MPLRNFLFLMALVLTAAGATIALVWALGIHFAWLGLAALILAYLVRRAAS